MERHFHVFLEQVYLILGVQHVRGVGLGCVYLKHVLVSTNFDAPRHVSLLINLESVLSTGVQIQTPFKRPGSLCVHIEIYF